MNGIFIYKILSSQI